MIKKLKNRLTVRNGFVTGAIVIVAFNLIFVAIYYQLYLNKQINKHYVEVLHELEKEIDSFSFVLKESEDIEKTISEYQENHKEIIITLKDENNNLVDIYTSKENKNNNIVISKIITNQNKTYLLTFHRKNNFLTFPIVCHFFFFEIFTIIILGIVGMTGANFKIFNPLLSLSQDVNNYKLGILPKKRKVTGGIDILQNDFVDLVETLEEEKQKQNRIIASISHDIKTPLTSILGYSSILLNNEKINEENQKKYANKIYSKSLVMKEIVEEFDDYLSCNIKDDKKIEKISLSALVDYLNNYYKDELKEKDIDFKIKCDCPNKLIAVDLAKFKRIFSNTITNSLRHYDSDKKLLYININEEKDEIIRFEVADNGTGCKEDLEKIFEPLYTTDKSRKISGLGLSICKEVVLSHGGTIIAENNKYGGFSIIFTIKAYKEK